MSKLGTFSSYLIFTSMIGLFVYTINLLVNLYPPAYTVNTMFVGTNIGLAMMTFIILVYPLQLSLWAGIILGLSYFASIGFVFQEVLLILSCLILLNVGGLLQRYDEGRR
jgi:hypothetical protein